ncbi:T9SS type A sorting domain-containing protein [Flavobacterium sp.]|uniref:T9SS type A sorting domain-containing protein n=1 Tax=Flavobacterium sp. TaxID=239 RepID=UPI00286E791E|nr:T9SS type A sorting domain-containing protein [Flavobacterium sp.]
MKKITILLVLMFSALGFSQNLITNGDFESGAAGWSGNSANVVTEGGNSYNSANVLVAGQAYEANLSYVLPLTTQGKAYKLTFTAFSDTNRTLIAGIGLNEGPWTANVQTVDLTSTSKTFVLNFISGFASANSRVIFDMGAATGFVGIDNVILEEVTTTCNNGVKDGDETGVDCGGTCSPCFVAPTPPTTAAPTPPARPAADVKSIYSNAYAPIAVLGYSGDDNSFSTNWSPAATSEVMVEGNSTNVVTGLGTGNDLNSSFEGIAFQAGRFDASSFTYFHMDIWTSTPTLDKSFNLKFSNWNGGGGESNAIEYSVTNGNLLPNPNPGTWISLDIPLADWSAGSRNDLVQFIITSNLGTVYYDNLYLHKGTLGTQKFETSKVKMYPNPVKNTLTIEANNEIQRVSVYTILGQEVLKASPKSNTATLQTSQLQKGVYMVTTEIDGKSTTSKIVKE